MQKTYSSHTIVRQDADPSSEASDNHPGAGEPSQKRRFPGSINLNKLVAVEQSSDGLLSRIIDGTLPALTLLVLTLMVDLLIYPIQASAKIEGLFIYFFVILALGIYSLDRSTAARNNETSRALWGMAGGLFLWHAVWMIQLFANFDFESPGLILILLIVTLVGLTLWRPVLPLGAKFFLLSFLMSWYSRIFVIQLLGLSAFGLIPAGTFYLTGFLALVAALICIGYLIYKAEFRVQRYWVALVLWQVSLIGLSVTMGALF